LNLRRIHYKSSPAWKFHPRQVARGWQQDCYTHTHTQAASVVSACTRWAATVACARSSFLTAAHTHTVPAAFALKLLHPLLQPLVGSHQTRSCLVILGLGPAQQRIPHAGIWRCALPSRVLGLWFRLTRAALPPCLGSNTILAQQHGTPLLYRQGDVGAEQTFAALLRCRARRPARYNHSPRHGSAYARLSLPGVHASGAVPLLRDVHVREGAYAVPAALSSEGRAADWAARFAGRCQQ
jgi:hypothetical protein